VLLEVSTFTDAVAAADELAVCKTWELLIVDFASPRFVCKRDKHSVSCFPVICSQVLSPGAAEVSSVHRKRKHVVNPLGITMAEIVDTAR